ncbi:MAG: MlaE family lipid ABC transporter permease subunit [Roseobacter sp.]|jgi:phospholipid/cholesterol/gamma-HCH transport system permease protein
MANLEIISDTGDGAVVLNLSGRLVTRDLQSVEASFAKVPSGTGPARIDLSHLEALDTGGALMIARLQNRLAKEGSTLEITGASDDNARLLETVRKAVFEDDADDQRRKTISDLIAGVGIRVTGSGKELLSLVNFLGLTMHRLVRTLLHPSRLRATALVAQMQQTGYSAVPIISLMGLLIGVVLAFQGSQQLRQFGAEVFVVDLIAVSVLRELGILLTAIIIAGRSGSAFAASIGSMKVNEEIDAMRTLGLDPIEVLVLPRVIALVLMLPVLGLVANVTALFGGAMMSWIELGVSPSMFLTRFYDNTDVWHLAVGMIKAPVFALIIGVVSCWQGFQVGGSAESVGRRTTSSVVQSVFLVIVMDAIFSVFFSLVGV